MFARPILRAGTMLETIDEGLLIHPQQAAFQVHPHPLAQDAFDMLPFEGRWSERVGDLVRHHGRLGRRAGQSRQDQQCRNHQVSHKNSSYCAICPA